MNVSKTGVPAPRKTMVLVGKHWFWGKKEEVGKEHPAMFLWENQGLRLDSTWFHRSKCSQTPTSSSESRIVLGKSSSLEKERECYWPTEAGMSFYKKNTPEKHLQQLKKKKPSVNSWGLPLSITKLFLTEQTGELRRLEGKVGQVVGGGGLADPGQSRAGRQQAPRALFWATGNTFHLFCSTKDSWHPAEMEFEEDKVWVSVHHPSLSL